MTTFIYLFIYKKLINYLFFKKSLTKFKVDKTKVEFKKKSLAKFNQLSYHLK